MRLFLTGGTGFLGGHFLAAALGSGYGVTALRRRGSDTRISLSQEPEWCDGNLDDNWSCKLPECDAMVHLMAAGVSAHKDDWDLCFQVNVSQSLALWRQAISCGIKQFLICGSCFEYGLTGLEYDYIPSDAPLLPVDAYSASKAAATIAAIGLATKHNLKLLVVRPFHLFGEGETETRFWPSLVRAAKSGVDFQMTEGMQVRDFMRVQDAAKVILDSISHLGAMTAGYDIKNIGTGSPMTLLSFAQQEWHAFRAKGQLLPGRLKYRENEVMRYVPLVN